MNFSKQIAKHLKEVYFGGNWTWSNLKENLSDITWQEATTQVDSLNTIAVLFHHIHYYVVQVTKVLQGEALESKDEQSFAHPPINSQQDWENCLNKAWKEAEVFIALIEQLPDSKLGETFVAEKYGIYYRNLSGIVEHTHYHLGQIAIIKKLLRSRHQKN